jgi:hypothetical protein
LVSWVISAGIEASVVTITQFLLDEIQLRPYFFPDWQLMPTASGDKPKAVDLAGLSLLP